MTHTDNSTAWCDRRGTSTSSATQRWRPQAEPEPVLTRRRPPPMLPPMLPAVLPAMLPAMLPPS